MAVNGELKAVEVNVPAATFDTILVLDFGYDKTQQNLHSA